MRSLGNPRIKLLFVSEVGGDGVEPPEPMAADLQSAPLPLTVYPPK